MDRVFITSYLHGWQWCSITYDINVHWHNPATVTAVFSNLYSNPGVEFTKEQTATNWAVTCCTAWLNAIISLDTLTRDRTLQR